MAKLGIRIHLRTRSGTPRNWSWRRAAREFLRRGGHGSRRIRYFLNKAVGPVAMLAVGIDSGTPPHRGGHLHVLQGIIALRLEDQGPDLTVPHLNSNAEV